MFVNLQALQNIHFLFSVGCVVSQLWCSRKKKSCIKTRHPAEKQKIEHLVEHFEGPNVKMILRLKQLSTFNKA